ncbi:cbb3-type cytochrome c oxidase subunit I [Chlamydiia bacterium]|nr:cbb3-type cytochrome c oxidase subunit I [Chlamydiia bacterium]
MIKQREYNDNAVRMMMYPAMGFLILGLLVGLFISLNVYVWPNYFVGQYIHFGRLRPLHVSTVLFLWLLSSGIGVMYFIVQRLTSRPLWSAKLARYSAWGWWFVVPLGVLSLPFGTNFGWEYAELPMFVSYIPTKLLFLIVWIMIATNIIMTVFQKNNEMLYVSLWYFLGMCFWTAVVVFVGFFVINWVPQGISRVNVNFFYVHNIVGFIFTPIGLGTAYYILPRVLQKPLYSHSLSMLGFWTLAFVYTWVGSHHIIHGPVVQWLQTLSIVFSMWLIIPVLSVVMNLFLTMKGAWLTRMNDVRVKLIMFGTLLYLVVSIQGSFMALRHVNEITSKTDWVIGHAHLALMGTFTFFAYAAFFHIIPVISRAPLALPKVAMTSVNCSIYGILIYVFSLSIGGYLQGMQWARWAKGQTYVDYQSELSKLSFLDTLGDVRIWWMLRALGGAIFLLGAILFIFSMVSTIKHNTKNEVTS